MERPSCKESLTAKRGSSCHGFTEIKRETLQNAILKNVKYGSTVYTDDAVGYDVAALSLRA